MREGDPLFMGSRLFPSEMEGEGDALFARYDLLFLIDTQVARVFCPNKCLTTLGVVTCVIHGMIHIKAERS